MATTSPKTRGNALHDSWMTATRRREIGGAVLVVLAVVTLVAFVSDGGLFTDRWVDFLKLAFGWGAYLLPMVIGGLGAWLVVDAADGEPEMSWERPAAAALSLTLVLGLVHLIVALRPDTPGPGTLAQLRMAGGWLGFGVAELFSFVLGPIPATFAMALLTLPAVAVAAGMTLKDLGRQGQSWSRMVLDAVVDGARFVHDEVDVWTGDDDWDGVEIEPAIAEAVTPPTSDVLVPGASNRAQASEQAVESEGPPGPAATRDSAWQVPDLDGVLDPAPEIIRGPDDAEARAKLIEDTYSEFGVPVSVVEINRGPTVTQFGLEPGYVTRAGRRSRVKVSKIVNLQNDLALALAASPIRIQAPVPGRPFVGVEVPNTDAAVVTLRSIIEGDAFKKLAAKGGLPLALGRDTSGNPVVSDLTAMPHLLIAGATGAGKSVALNGIVSTLLVTHTPDTLKLLLVDPKRVEMTPFRGLPHLAAPVVVDVERVIGVLEWAVREMDRRYKTFAECGARNIKAYNEQAARLELDQLPYLVLVVDELADLMMLAPEEVERLITRLAQLARATGIHLIIATQRPSVDVVTGLIKANFPSRIAFAVASSTDSRVILDASGAEKLLGRGDMLFVSSDSSKVRRLQGCYVSDGEIHNLTNYWRRAVPETALASEAAEMLGVPNPMIEADQWEQMLKDEEEDDRDPLWGDAVALIREHDSISTSFLQRKLRIGYSRAGRMIDMLEEAGYIGPAQGTLPRDILAEFDEDGQLVVPGSEIEQDDDETEVESELVEA